MHLIIDTKTLVYLAGISHFGILIASSLTPFALDLRQELKPLPELLRQMFWVYGAFIVMTIIGFGTLSLLFADMISQGIPLARGLCALIAVFWGVRLGVQFFVFDARPYLTRRLFHYGYHTLTLVFIFLTTTYGYLALQ